VGGVAASSSPHVDRESFCTFLCISAETCVTSDRYAARRTDPFRPERETGDARLRPLAEGRRPHPTRPEAARELTENPWMARAIDQVFQETPGWLHAIAGVFRLIPPQVRAYVN